jgi:hypothetical protein
MPDCTMFVEEDDDLFDSFSGVMHYLDCAKLYIAVLPVPVSTWNNGEVPLIR